MPTRKPRLTITLDPRLHETISRMSKVSGDSMSEIINSFLMAMHEPLMRTVAVLEAAKDAPESVRKGLHDTAEKLERDLCSFAEAGLVQLDMLFPEHEEGSMHEKLSDLLGSVLEFAECTKEDQEGSAEGSPNPHVVTRGSGLSAGRKVKGLGGTRSGDGEGGK